MMMVICDIVRQIITFKDSRRRGRNDMIAACDTKFHPPIQNRKKKAFLACSEGVELSAHFQKKLDWASLIASLIKPQSR